MWIVRLALRRPYTFVATFYTLFFVPVAYSRLRGKPPKQASDGDEK
jgi:hypothetical protein